MRTRREAPPTEPAALAARIGEIAGRAACSDAERRAAQDVAAALRGRGMLVTRHTPWVRPQWPLPLALLALLGVAGGVVAVDHPVAGLVLAATALLLAVGEATERLTSVRRLLPARATEVVTGEPDDGGGDGRVTLVLTADLDAPRRALLDRVPWPVAWILLALAVVAGACVARVAGAEGTAIGIAQLVPSALLIVAAGLLLDAAFAPALRGPGTASGLAVALRAADALAARPPRHLRIAVVAAGAGNAHGAGLRAWLRARRRSGGRREDHVVLHVGPVGATPPRWWVREGLAFPLRAHPQLLESVRRAAEAERHLGARRASSGTWSGARSARALRWPALRVGGSGRPSTAAAPDAERAVAELVLALVAALDAHLDR